MQITIPLALITRVNQELGNSTMTRNEMVYALLREALDARAARQRRKTDLQQEFA